ncbi:MAG: hypothetical protein ACKPKO_20140, partial [Candidatus Fonsibacter sp.]
MATKRKQRRNTYNIKKPRKRLSAFEQRLASVVEVVVADGAADEQLASRMLHKSCARTSLGHALPNLCLVVRGKPHNARRLLQRTLPKYKFICTLMTNLLWSRELLARLAKHSHQHQETCRAIKCG